jgi:hypothetical protein
MIYYTRDKHANQWDYTTDAAFFIIDTWFPKYIRKFSDFWTCSTSLFQFFLYQILQWPYKNYLVCITIYLHRTENTLLQRKGF